MSALGMVIGSSYAGKKSMTATSGPGVSLMVELMGLSSMAEIPVVIVDAQRAGPSTGMPTRQEQGDLFLATMGGHGEIQRIVLAPVLLMGDTTLGVRTESIPTPDLSKHPIVHRLGIGPNGSNGSNGSNGANGI